MDEPQPVALSSGVWCPTSHGALAIFNDYVFQEYEGEKRGASPGEGLKL